MMLLKKVPLNEEVARMRILAGTTSQATALEEGFMSKLSALLGIGAMSLTSVLAQTGNLEKLQYSADKKAALEQAMTDNAVVRKLHDLGVEDNNIQRAIDYSKGKEITGYQDKVTSSERQMKTLVKAGWHLTAAQSDTIINQIASEHPQAVVDTILFSLHEGEMFASGKFTLSESDRANIMSILDSINKSGSVLLNVTIISSTDKQGLTTNLQNTLSNLGYSPNNEGLSKARSSGIFSVLTSIGVDSSMINQETLFERGGPTIDQSARYVKVAFDVAKIPTVIPGGDNSGKTSVKTTYELFKPTFKYGTVNVGQYKSKVCRTNILKYTKKGPAINCASW